jgi:hypothetical protein
MGRKLAEILQDIEAKSNHHTSFDSVISTTSISDSNQWKKIFHGSTLHEMK